MSLQQQEFSKSNKYRGQNSLWFSFKKQFVQMLRLERIADLTNYAAIDKHLSAFAISPPTTTATSTSSSVAPPTTATSTTSSAVATSPTLDRRLERAYFAEKAKNSFNCINKLNGDHLHAYGLLEDIISEDVFRSIASDIVVNMTTIQNPYNITELVKFRATINALQQYCIPDVATAVQLTKNKYANTSPTASLAAIVDAIRIHESELSLLQCIDATGNPILSSSGDPTYHTFEPTFMYTTLCHQLNDKNDSQKYAVYNAFMTSATTSTRSFETLFKMVQNYLKNTINFQPTNVTNTSSSPISTFQLNAQPNVLDMQLPAVPMANIARHQQSNYRQQYPQRHPSTRYSCRNCESKMHETRNCPEIRCGSCPKLVFKTLEERKAHARAVHSRFGSQGHTSADDHQHYNFRSRTNNTNHQQSPSTNHRDRSRDRSFHANNVHFGDSINDKLHQGEPDDEI